MTDTRVESCIAAIDQGTSSTRVLIIKSSGQILNSYQIEHTQYYPVSGQVEHDPMEIWNSVLICLSEAIAGISLSTIKIVSIGITNQRETTIVWNKDNGLPYHNAIVWNDNRTSSICDQLASVSEKGIDRFRDQTGLPLAPYFSASKLLYLLRNVPTLRQDAIDGKAIFGTIDTWIIWKLTNGHMHSTDVTNASRTLLMNIHTLQWDSDILHQLDIPIQMLPQIHPSSCNFGTVNIKSLDMSYIHESIKKDRRDIDTHQVKHCSFYDGVPITGVLGDQHAALFGQTCFNEGDTKCTFGTGAFLLLNTGHRIVPSRNGMLTTVAYQIAKHAPVYALEGAVSYSGSTIQWLRDNLQIIDNASESEALASSVADNGGVYFVPAFSGLFAPYWKSSARGLIAGLTAYHNKAHIVRAALESSAFQVHDVVRAMEIDCDRSLMVTCLRVDGGMTANNLLMQFLSDVLGTSLVKPLIAETTAMGVAYMAGLGVGLWSSVDELKGLWCTDKSWQPVMTAAVRDSLVRHWKKAISRSIDWVDDDDDHDHNHDDDVGDVDGSSNSNKADDPVDSIDKEGTVAVPHSDANMSVLSAGIYACSLFGCGIIIGITLGYYVQHYGKRR